MRAFVRAPVCVCPNRSFLLLISFNPTNKHSLNDVSRFIFSAGKKFSVYTIIHLLLSFQYSGEMFDIVMVDLYVFFSDFFEVE